MKKNNLIHFLLPLFAARCSDIGGQAVMDGVMLRNGDVYGLAVRQPDGTIRSERRPWQTLVNRIWLRIPFCRGFPILMESLVNGIQALNRSLAMTDGEEGEEKNASSMAVSVVAAMLMAIGLFVIAPHLLSLVMTMLGLGGDVEGITFHLWDGFYKCLVFLLYIWLISFVPDIRRVFEYHGAEHKIIHAWENDLPLSAPETAGMSRLHPRCGTTFLLFVICISIVLQAIIVPGLLKLWTPEGMITKHALSILYKLLLIVPISAAAYELIRFAAHLPRGKLASCLQAPGLALQRMTTREPSPAQLEVAIAALNEALADDFEDGVFIENA